MRLAANMVGSASSSASTTVRLSARLTTKSSGKGRKGSSISATTCECQES